MASILVPNVWRDKGWWEQGLPVPLPDTRSNEILTAPLGKSGAVCLRFGHWGGGGHSPGTVTMAGVAAFLTKQAPPALLPVGASTPFPGSVPPPVLNNPNVLQ